MIKRITQMTQPPAMDEKRRFERIDIKPEAQIVVLDQMGRKAGVLRQLARGGFSMVPEKPYTRDNTIYEFTIHEPTEDIRVQITARIRSADQHMAGFEFVDLDVRSAVDIGIIIGKYYEQSKV
jgi:hypothetical protein